MKNIIAYRIRNARKLQLLSQQEVANEVGVSKQMISKYEKGESIPDSSKLIKLANLFGQKVDYFFRAFKVELGEVSFRKKSSFSQKRQDSLKEWIKIKLENYLYLEETLSIDSSFDNIIANNTIHSIEDIEKAVLKLRNTWNIGMDPVHNIIQILEDKEIKVIELDVADAEFDGLACFVDNKYPVIVVNHNFPVERKRFTLLHELAHLLLNFPNCDTKTEEQFCNKFASAFLLPKKIMIEDLGNKRKNISQQELIAIQKKYGISIQAIFYRLVDAKILSKAQLKKFFQKINDNPKLKEDIDSSRFETLEYSDRYERLVYRAVSEENITVSKASSLLNKDINSIKEDLAKI
jgi:Zn-dependent peptidase ImmA (M78 family)/DNA-binding XRE family transcriptional regulator